MIDFGNLAVPMRRIRNRILILGSRKGITGVRRCPRPSLCNCCLLVRFGGNQRVGLGKLRLGFGRLKGFCFYWIVGQGFIGFQYFIIFTLLISLLSVFDLCLQRL